MLPQGIRRELLAVPGEVMVRHTADGVLLSAVEHEGRVEQAPDGFPVLRLGSAGLQRRGSLRHRPRAL